MSDCTYIKIFLIKVKTKNYNHCNVYTYLLYKLTKKNRKAIRKGSLNIAKQNPTGTNVFNKFEVYVFNFNLMRYKQNECLLTHTSYELRFFEFSQVI